MIKREKPVKLFWTGGWDSTFRLIQLVLTYKKVVQPYYIIDQGRKSTLNEIRAMTLIKEALYKEYPETKNLLHPTIFKELSEIENNIEITKSYGKLKEKILLGRQYDWLARFCLDEAIFDMEFGLELCVNNGDNKVINIIGDNMEKFDQGLGISYRVNRNAKGNDVYNLFGNMQFPLFSYTKIEMYKFSIENGFDEILNLTWFCLLPVMNHYPCGKCNSCRTVYREGLAWRLPVISKIRYFVWPTLRRIVDFTGMKNIKKPN